MHISSKKQDRRYLRTEVFIISAFAELIAEKGFSAITITDIITKANIGRGTFYQHYNDKHHLLQSITDKLVGDVDTILSVKPAFMSEKGNTKDVVIELYTYFDDNVKLLQALLGENGDAAFKKSLFAVIHEHVAFKDEEFLRLTVTEHIPKEYRNILDDWMYNLFVVWLTTWIFNENRETPEEIWEIMLTVSKISYQKMFGKWIRE